MSWTMLPRRDEQITSNFWCTMVQDIMKQLYEVLTLDITLIFSQRLNMDLLQRKNVGVGRALTTRGTRDPICKVV